MRYPFFKKHKTQERFWDYRQKKWVKNLDTRECVIINFRGENIHPSLWNESWFYLKSQK